MSFQGACHCGRIEVTFQTSKAPDQLQVRACQCSFCTRHHGRTVSDPDGPVEFRAAPGALKRYRFATSSADFLLCAECGAYMGVVMAADGALYGIVNATGAGIVELAGRTPDPMDYSAETVEARTARRQRVWSPASVVER